MAKKAKAEKKSAKNRPKKRWSQKVTETSDAMTLENGVFMEIPSRSRSVSQAVGRPKHKAKVLAVPIRHVDAHLLREPGGEKSLRCTQDQDRQSQGRTLGALLKRIEARNRLAAPYIMTSWRLERTCT